MVACLGVLLAGCHNYVPVEAPRAGDHVRARLTTEAAIRRSEESDEPRRAFEGTVVSYTPERLELDVVLARSASEFHPVEFSRTLAFDASEVDAILRQELNGVRTAFLVAGIVGGAVVLLDQIVEVGGNAGDGDGDGEQPALVPFFRIRLPR